MKAVIKAILQALALVVIGGAAGLAANRVRPDGLVISRDYLSIRTADPEAVGEPKLGGLPAHDFQTITLEEVIAALNDPHYRPEDSDSKIFFIDARDDVNFSEGHIRGALQVDHYYVERYLPDVLSMIENAEKLIVYCGGGDCEDSIHVCNDLMKSGVPHEKIFLFEGGIKAWTAAQQPLQAGKY